MKLASMAEKILAQLAVVERCRDSPWLDFIHYTVQELRAEVHICTDRDAEPRKPRYKSFCFGIL